MSQAKTVLEKALKESNDFFANDWTPFKTKMEQIDVPDFKEVKTINIE